MKDTRLLPVLLAAAMWCALAPLAGAWQQAGSYYRNPYTGSFTYGRPTYNPYTGRNEWGTGVYNSYTGSYPAATAYPAATTYYNTYTNVYARPPVAYNPYTGRYDYRPGYGRR